MSDLEPELRDEPRERTGAGQPGRLAVAVVGLLFGALVLLSTEAYLYSRNTLVENGRWCSTKVFLKMTPMGAHHFLLTRNALQGNRLHLGAWHANNEVHYRDQLDPGVIDISCKLHDGAYLCVLFNRGEDGYDGIRLSRSELYPSQFFRADRAGRFLSRVPLEFAPLGPGAHRLVLDFEDQRVHATLDGAALALPAIAPLRAQWFGFRSGKRPADVESVRVVGRDGSVLLFESFRNTRGYRRTAALAALAWFVALGLFWILRRRKSRAALFELAGLQVVLLACGSTLFAFDFFHWSKLYPYIEFTPDGEQELSLTTRVEDLRSRLFGNPPKTPLPDQALRTEEIAPLLTSRDWSSTENPWGAAAQYYAPLAERPLFVSDGELEGLGREERSTRIFLLGSSQTWGQGADALEHTFVSRLHRQLDSLATDSSIETFNFAQPGTRSALLLDAYERRWLALQPDLVVIVLGCNDHADPDALSENLRRFLQLSRDRGVEVVLVVEPMLGPDLETHRRIRALRETPGVEVLDLHAHMGSDAVRDVGFLWWDFVHPTSLGHLEIAEWLAARLAPGLGRLTDR